MLVRVKRRTDPAHMSTQLNPTHTHDNIPIPQQQQQNNTHQGLVADITEASRVLLELNGPDLAQFRQRLDDQFFRTSVGSVMPESDGAFEEVGGWGDVGLLVWGGRVYPCVWVLTHMFVHPSK